MADYRYFKCNRIGGFRLSDLNKEVKQGEYFYVDSHVAETSRSVIASIRERWMLEVTEREASKYISPVRKLNRGGVVETNIGTKKAVNESVGLSIPNVKDVNINLESRQAERNKLQNIKTATPNLEEVKKKTEERQKEEKQGTTNVVGPDIKKVEENRKEEQNKKEKEEKPEKLESPVTAKYNETVKSLSVEDDDQLDNSLVSIPNLDEKKENSKEDAKEEVKKELTEKVQKKIRRKKNKTE